MAYCMCLKINFCPNYKAALQPFDASARLSNRRLKDREINVE